jgi:anti-sigma-K factor RskA
MSERPQDQRPARLPREWLPQALPTEDSPLWEAAVERVLAAAEAELVTRDGASVVHTRASTWALLGLWWKPAAALAAAAAAALVFVDRPPATAPSTGSLSLSVLAAEGDPLALWGVDQEPPHPVLALIAAEPDIEEDR